MSFHELCNLPLLFPCTVDGLAISCSNHEIVLVCVWLRQNHYAPQVWPAWCSNSWPMDHDRIFSYHWDTYISDFHHSWKILFYAHNCPFHEQFMTWVIHRLGMTSIIFPQMSTQAVIISTIDVPRHLFDTPCSNETHYLQRQTIIISPFDLVLRETRWSFEGRRSNGEIRYLPVMYLCWMSRSYSFSMVG